FFSSRRRHTRSKRDWSSDVCSSDLVTQLDFKLSNKTAAAAELKSEVASLSPDTGTGDYDGKIEIYTQQMGDINTRIDMMSRSKARKKLKFHSFKVNCSS